MHCLLCYIKIPYKYVLTVCDCLYNELNTRYIKAHYCSSKSDISGPPVKKRRSKWDMMSTESTETTPTGAAAAAAAKINAMLAAKGKLGNSDNVILVSTSSMFLCKNHYTLRTHLVAGTKFSYSSFATFVDLTILGYFFPRNFILAFWVVLR